MILNILDDLEKSADKFRDFVVDNNSPAFMLAVFVIGLAVFFLTYGALHKND